MASQPSLDRLKGLDSLPDLSSQLEEAKQLCTHSARADMVARWLLDKLKSSEETRASVEAWRILLLTVRLISSTRLATLLSTHRFFDTICLVLEDPEGAEIAFEPLLEILIFLQETSTSPNGSSLRAILCLPASQASLLLGLWMQCMRTKVKVNKAGDYHAMLQPALQTWALRKSSADENEHFSWRCLFPAALLLYHVSSEEPKLTLKRKRKTEQPAIQENVTRALEALLARHIFLPARNAFFGTQNGAHGVKAAQTGSQRDDSSIDHMFRPLKKLEFREDKQIERISQALPLLLDIALRCVATSTPRQRTKERPWVEAVFAALLECDQVTDDEVGDRKALIAMLVVISTRATLSKKTLRALIRENTVLESPSVHETSLDLTSIEHWQLVAQIISLDAEIFTASELTTRLLDCISLACARIENTHKEAEITDTQKPEDAVVLPSLLMDNIVAPIAAAFAQGRMLTDFVELWFQQMTTGPADRIRPLWTEIDRLVAPLFEEALHENQIQALYDRFASIVAAAVGELDASEDKSVSPHVCASAVVLNAILLGLRSEALADQLGLACEKLLFHLFQLFEKSKGGVARVRIFALLANALNLWFPGWASRQTEKEVIVERCDWLLSSNALKTACWTQVITRSEDGFVADNQLAKDETTLFIASVCQFVSPYSKSLTPSTQQYLSKAVSRLVATGGLGHWQALSLYPDVIRLVRDSKTRSEFIEDCITFAVSNEEFPDDGHLVFSKWPPVLMALIVTEGQQEWLEDVVQTTIKFLVNDDQTKTTKQQKLVAIDLLARIPFASLSRAQREQILDTLMAVHHLEHQDLQLLDARFGLAVRLMQLPNATSLLSTDHATLWEVLSAGNLVDSDDGPQDQTAESLALREELARQTVNHLLATQDQQRSHATLLNLSNTVVRALIDANLEIIARKPSMFVICKAILRELEASGKDELMLQLPHRKPATGERIGRCLVEAVIEAFKTDAISDLGSSRALALTILLDLVLAMLDDARMMPGGDIAETYDTLLGAFGSQLTEATRDGTKWKSQSRWHKLVFIRCFQISCRQSDDPSLFAATALGLFDMGPYPSDFESLLSTCNAYIGRLDGDNRDVVLKYLLDASRDLRPTTLLLLRCFLATIEKDNPPLETHTPPQLLSILLSTFVESQQLLQRQRATSSILLMLREKPFLVNQYGVDETLAALIKLLQECLTDTVAYRDITQILSALLLNHRARLQGRFHLVIKVYQLLISELFQDPTHPSSRSKLRNQLGPKQAQALTRVLTLFCEPPLLHRSGNITALTDESRKEQAHVGQYIQYVLHHYCSQILVGSLADGVKDALTPGLWTMIEAIEMNDADGTKSLSAAMTNSERAVLRDVYAGWKRFGKWKGG